MIMLADMINDYVKDRPAYRVGITMDDVREDYVLADFRDDICKMNENENLLGVSPKAVKAIIIRKEPEKHSGENLPKGMACQNITI